MASEQTVGHFVSLQRGLTYKGSLVDEPGPALLGLGSIIPGGGFRDDHKTYGGECPPHLMLGPGDLFVSLKGATKDGEMIGSVARVPDYVASGRLTQDTVGLKFGGDKRNHLSFLYWVLRTPQYRDYCRGRATGSAVVALSREDFLNYPVPKLTPMRGRLVALFDAIEAKIELNRRMNLTLEGMARAIFKSWFVDFDPVRAKAAMRREHPDWSEDQINRAACPRLRSEIAALFSDAFEDSELGEIPKGWRVGTVKDVCEFAYGKALKEEQREPGDVPVMGSNGQVGLHNESLVKGPGIVVGRKGNPGIVTWVNTDFYPIDTTFYVVKSLDYPLAFLVHALDALNLASLGADSAVPGLNRNIAYGTQLCIPTSELLATFDKQATAIRNRVEAGEKESRTLATLRDALLPKLITGELRVPDAEGMVGRAV